MERHITKKNQTGKTKKKTKKNKKKSRSLGLEPCEKDFRIIVFFFFFGLGFLFFFGLVFLVFPIWFRSFVILFCSDISGIE